jgi:hypothetical protein
LCSTKLMRHVRDATLAGATNRPGVDRQGALTGTEQYIPVRIRHISSRLALHRRITRRLEGGYSPKECFQAPLAGITVPS